MRTLPAALAALLVVPFLAGCPAAPPAAADGSGEEEGRTFEDFVNTTEAYTGDTSCLAGPFNEVDPAKQGLATLDGIVMDFQDDEPVEVGAEVKFWYGDDIAAAPDVVTTADGDGRFSARVPMCTPVGYETSTPPDLEETVDTYEVHQVYDYYDTMALDEQVNSVSQSTSRLIPSIIGVEWDTTMGIIAGTAYDCNLSGLGHVQVYLHDADGNPPESGTVYYFTDNDLPADTKYVPDSNPNNGLWVAVNVPVGTWTVEMHGYNGSGYDNLGATQLTIKANSVNISNIYPGRTDGIAYPDSCTADG
jgi:hypothetical protein